MGHQGYFYGHQGYFLSFLTPAYNAVSVVILVKGLLATKFTLQVFGIKRFTMSYSAVL